MGNTTDNTGIAAQCAAHKYLEALAITAVPNAALETARANMSSVTDVSSSSRGCVSIRTG